MKIDEMKCYQYLKLGALEGVPLIWRKMDKNNIFICERPFRMPFDVAEPKNKRVTRQKGGDNCWYYSNIRQWLNTRGRDWFEPRNATDTISEEWNKAAGFKSLFSLEELDIVEPYTIKTRATRDRVKELGEYYETTDCFWLGSIANCAMRKFSPEVEAERDMCYNGVLCTMTRTASRRDGGKILIARYFGNWTDECNMENECRPLMKVKGDTEIEEANEIITYKPKFKMKRKQEMINEWLELI